MGAEGAESQQCREPAVQRASGAKSQPASSHISSHISCPVSRPLIACRCTGLRKQGLLDEQEFAEARKMLMRKWKKK
jgi:hypothetical protein